MLSQEPDPIYLASVEAVEEAVVNAIVAGVDVDAVMPKGLTIRAIDTAKLADEIRELASDIRPLLPPAKRGDESNPDSK